MTSARRTQRSTELEALERTLMSLPLVEDSVVRRRYTARREEQIVAYVVLGVLLAPHALREELERVLPPDALPDAYVGMTAIPVLADGEVDEEGTEVDASGLASRPASTGDWIGSGQLARASPDDSKSFFAAHCLCILPGHAW